MILKVYRQAARLSAPGLTLMLQRRVKRAKENQARLGERYGISTLTRPAGRLIWFHAASVGETLSALPVINALQGRAEILLTTGTITSAVLAAERLPPFARHQFAPLDVPSWVIAFLEHWRPDAAVFVESELWPCMLDECDARGIPRMLMNARLSSRSVRNWQRAQGLAAHVIKPFRYIHAQSTQDAENLRAIGAVGVLEWGNLKFASAPLPYDVNALAAFQVMVTGPVWLAASTHPGEEEIILAAHEALTLTTPDLLTIIVPRHPERGAQIAALCNAPRRSLGEAPVAGKVYIADTMGELGLFFRAAPFAFIGNSLVGFGGHNLIEPARLARPVIAGPHLENFKAAAEALAGCGALVSVQDAQSLATAVGSWLNNSDHANMLGDKAAACFAPSDQLPERLTDLIMGMAL